MKYFRDKCISKAIVKILVTNIFFAIKLDVTSLSSDIKSLVLLGTSGSTFHGLVDSKHSS